MTERSDHLELLAAAALLALVVVLFFLCKPLLLPRGVNRRSQ